MFNEFNYSLVAANSAYDYLKAASATGTSALQIYNY
jgi:hypothetical protein